MTRYFPEVVAAVKANLPARCVDAELVVPDADGRGSTSTPCCCASTRGQPGRPAGRPDSGPLVAFDLLALDETDHMGEPFARRRAALKDALARWSPGAPDPGHHRPEAGRRVAGPLRGPAWTAWSPSASTGCTSRTGGPGARSSTRAPPTAWWPATGCTSAAPTWSARCCWACTPTMGSWPWPGSSAPSRWCAAGSCSPSSSRCATSFEGHPGTGAPGCGRPRPPAAPGGVQQQPLEPGQAVVRAPAARAGGRGPLRPPGGPPLPHTAQFQRWRPDRDPRSCTYDQLEETVGYDLADVLATPRPDRRPQVTSTDPSSGRPVGR